MVVDIDEPVAVGVVFDRGGVRPVWLVWQGRKRVLREVTLRWQGHEGRATLAYFSVTDGTQLYELCLHAEHLTWRLTKVETP
ncbi:MAG: hypothetical protein HY597_03780 [Candidatus Omnitrophica bacterium]|nr:hypothetical protein [Candidatus Omnitrophota bacterium]